jgi:hypothetical protein
LGFSSALLASGSLSAGPDLRRQQLLMRGNAAIFSNRIPDFNDPEINGQLSIDLKFTPTIKIHPAFILTF